MCICTILSVNLCRPLHTTFEASLKPPAKACWLSTEAETQRVIASFWTICIGLLCEIKGPRLQTKLSKIDLHVSHFSLLQKEQTRTSESGFKRRLQGFQESFSFLPLDSCFLEQSSWQVLFCVTTSNMNLFLFYSWITSLLECFVHCWP